MDHDAASFALLTLADWSDGHGLHQVSYALEQALVAVGSAADNVELAAELRHLAAGHREAAAEERRAQRELEEEGRQEIQKQREEEADEAALAVALGADVPPAPVEVVVTEEPPAPVEVVVTEEPPVPAQKPAGRKRAHQPDGSFRADDPTTPGVNEAFVDGGSAAT